MHSPADRADRLFARFYRRVLLFTLGAGVLGLALIPFGMASAVGRGARFFLVAKLVAAAGPRLVPQVERYIEFIGWASVVIVLSGVGWLTLAH